MKKAIFLLCSFIFCITITCTATSKIPRKDGHWSTCDPLPGCPYPPIGCFRGGNTCGVSACGCPELFKINNPTEAQLIKIATDFASKKIQEGVTDEDGKQELIDFVLKVLKESK